jgi:carbon monoxide dehydrogenase subunit G
MEFELTCMVEAPVDRVFELIENASQARDRWSTVPGDPPELSGVGPLWIPVPGPTSVSLTAHDSPSRLSYRWALGESMDGDVEYELAPAGSGTRVRQRVSMRAGGLLRLVFPIVRRAFHSACERRLERIRSRFDAREHKSEPLSWPPDPPAVHGVATLSTE